MITGMSVGALVFLGYGFASPGWQVHVPIVFGALQALVHGSLNRLLSRMFDASNQGALQGGLASIASLAAVFGPLALTQALAAGAERGFPAPPFCWRRYWRRAPWSSC